MVTAQQASQNLGLPSRSQAGLAAVAGLPLAGDHLVDQRRTFHQQIVQLIVDPVDLPARIGKF